jgi:hypothetical protein
MVVCGGKKEWYVGGTVQRAVREVELAELSGCGRWSETGVDGRWSIPSKNVGQQNESEPIKFKKNHHFKHLLPYCCTC